MKIHRKLYEYSLWLLSRRRYTVKEITKKLQKRQIGTPEEIEAIIARLLMLKYLNDDEFTELFIADQLMRKPQGSRSLKNKLQLKGISKDLIEEKFRDRETDELALAKQALAKKARMMKDVADPKSKAKLFRFLASRGFNQGTIYQLLKMDTTEWVE